MDPRHFREVPVRNPKNGDLAASVCYGPPEVVVTVLSMSQTIRVVVPTSDIPSELVAMHEEGSVRLRDTSPMGQETWRPTPALPLGPGLPFRSSWVRDVAGARPEL